MDRVAIFVDAGYLFAQGSAAITGKKKPRGEINVDLDLLLSALEDFSRTITGLPLLRIYWYDGTATGPTPQHIALAFKPRVKVRLGFVNTAGQQKGVDSLIVTDMITLARNRSMCEAVLLSGDEDLRVGVQQAQEFGVRVHLLGITPCRGSQSQFLLQEADATHEWTASDIAKFLSCSTTPPYAQGPPTLPSSPNTEITIAGSQSPTISSPKFLRAGPSTIGDVAKDTAAILDKNLIDGIIKNFESTNQIPQQIDRPLLGRAKKFLGILNKDDLKQLRNAFISELRSRQKGSVSSKSTSANP